MKEDNYIYKHDSVRNSWKNFNIVLKNYLRKIISKQELSIILPWDVDYKTIGEIGGRLLEDFFLNKLIEESKTDERVSFIRVKARSIGDLECEYLFNDMKYTFHIDIKCNYSMMRERTLEYYKKYQLKGTKPGESHPNLMAVSKLKKFVEDGHHNHSDIVELFFSYDIEKKDNKVNFIIEDEFSQEKLFLIRDLGENNFTVGNLGRGQIQMYRFHDLKFEKRSIQEFLLLVEKKHNKIKPK